MTINWAAIPVFGAVLVWAGRKSYSAAKEDIREGLVSEDDLERRWADVLYIRERLDNLTDHLIDRVGSDTRRGDQNQTLPGHSRTPYDWRRP